MVYVEGEMFYEDVIYGGEGWVTYQFSSGNTYNFLSDVDLDLDIIQQTTVIENYSFIFNGSGPSCLLVQNYDDSFLFVQDDFYYQDPGSNSSAIHYIKMKHTYLVVCVSNGFDHMKVITPIGPEWNVASNDTWAVYYDLNWHLLNSSIEDGQLTATLTNDSSYFILSTF
ncbi:MAG: hypothetical protein ACTSXP_14210, partial [Promethearchaeota archaeon]